MSFGYVTVDGERLEVHVAAAFAALKKAFEAAFPGLTIYVTSGTRTRAEQEYLYNGWINRLPGFNLAAKPGFSNHEESGPSGPRSIDIADTGNDPGVTRRGSARDKWMEANAGRFEFENEGYSFNPVEAWHKTFRGVIGGGASGGGSSIPIDEKVLREQQFLNAARGEALVPDGQYGAATKAAYQRYQVFLRDNYGYTGEIDGIWGDGTQAAHAKFYAVWSAQQYPKFPLPAGYYFGPADGPEQSISGLYSYKGALTPWQQRMKDRGWPITPDGVYGNETREVTMNFQREKGLTVDGEIGPQTWDAAWTLPVTPPAGTTPPPAENIPEIPANPKTPDNPRGLPTYTPTYPGAYIGLLAPLGDGSRSYKGEAKDENKVDPVIDMFILHRTGTDGDDGDWFSYRNSRQSCPNLHVRTDARVREFIRAGMKPALTGPEWNYRSFGIEIQGAGDGNNAQFEVVADIMAWLASYNGKTLDGVPVRFTLDRQHVKNHRELIPGTECPGDWWADHMDALINRAKTILAEKYLPKPPEEMVPVPRSFLVNLQAELEASSTALDKYVGA